MKIRDMRATFGCLDGARLEPGEGLTVITAPNESGKSTWTGFLKSMLYGIDTKDRDKKGYLADKNRYQPWSGAPMEGELRVEANGRDMTIRRGPQKNTPFGTFQAVYTGTEEAVPGMTGENCGELLVGGSREIYERSAFVRQGSSLEITPDTSLEKRIATLATSGEEEISYSQVEGQLREWQRRRKHNKTGLIPKLEGELDAVRDTLSRLTGTVAAIARLEEEQRALEDRCARLKRELDAHDHQEKSDLHRRYLEAKNALEEAEGQLLRARQERERFTAIPDRETLKRAQGELAYLSALEPEIKRNREALEQAEAAQEQARRDAEDERFPGLSGEEAAIQSERDCASLRQSQERVASAEKRLPFLICGGLFAGAAVTALSWRHIGLMWAVVAAAVLFSVCTVAGGIWSAGVKRRESAKQAQLLRRYGAETPEEISAITEGYRAAQQCAQEAGLAVRQVKTALEDALARRENGRTDLLSFVHTFAPEVKDLFGVSAALSRALTADDALALARERAEGARRLYDELAGRGGEYSPGVPSVLPTGSREETAAALAEGQRALAQSGQELARVLGEQQALGDPAELSARAEELEGELARRNEEYAALELALTALKNANARMQERLSPALNRRAEEYFARLCGDRYQGVSLNRELEASVLPQGQVLPRKALALSQGTMDQLYLAVRLAVADLCLPGEEPAPLVLDDALASFDDERLNNALALLRELGKERQILLFTCQTREREQLAGAEGVTLLSLERQ